MPKMITYNQTGYDSNEYIKRIWLTVWIYEFHNVE